MSRHGISGCCLRIAGFNGADRFANNHQVVNHPNLGLPIRLEVVFPFRPLDFSDRLLNIEKSISKGSHIGTASRRTESLARSFKPSATIKSTFGPKRSRKSSRNPPKSKSEHSGSVSIRTSRSLSGPAVPRATDPKMRTLDACRLLARLRICSRRSRICCKFSIEFTIAKSVALKRAFITCPLSLDPWIEQRRTLRACGSSASPVTRGKYYRSQ